MDVMRRRKIIKRYHVKEMEDNQELATSIVRSRRYDAVLTPW